MSEIRGLLRVEGTLLGFWCPGCEEMHRISIATGGWKFDGKYDRPSITPSVKVTSGHFVPDWAERKKKDPNLDCWCSYNKKHPEDAVFDCECCHLFVTEGQIKFLGDCTHKLAGKSVAMTVPSV